MSSRWMVRWLDAESLDPAPHMSCLRVHPGAGEPHGPEDGTRKFKYGFKEPGVFGPHGLAVNRRTAAARL